MIQFIQETYNNFRKKTGIPIVFILFMFDLIIILEKQHNLLAFTDSWISKSIRNSIIAWLSLFNSYYLFSLIVIGVLLLIIAALYTWTHVFSFLPNDVEMSDETVVNWNPISAIRRLCELLILLVTNIWIYWLTINVLLNPYDFINEIFNIDMSKNNLIFNHYLTSTMLSVCWVFIYCNAFLIIMWMFKKLFRNSIPTSQSYIESQYLNLYTRINLFTHYENGVFNEVLMLKKNVKNKDVFYIVSGHYEDENNPFRHYVIRYEILNRSQSFAEIKYHFEILKSNNK